MGSTWEGRVQGQQFGSMVDEEQRGLESQVLGMHGRGVLHK